MEITGFDKKTDVPYFYLPTVKLREPYRIGKNKEIPFFKSENLEN